MNQNSQSLSHLAVDLLLERHLKCDTGFFIEVDFSDDSSSFLLHIKDAPAVGWSGHVHSVTDKTGWSTLQEGERPRMTSNNVSFMDTTNTIGGGLSR